MKRLVMKMKYEVRFSGTGGQGIIRCAVLLAEAVILPRKARFMGLNHAAAAVRVRLLSRIRQFITQR